MLDLPVFEIQEDEISEIAKTSAVDAARISKLPIIVEDAGLFIEALNGFPGPYSSYIQRTIGNEGIIKLMDNKNKREAYFHSVVAFCSPGQQDPICFEGRADGAIARKESGVQGFGFDPIFKACGAQGKTFAEMTTDQKKQFSHRAKSLRKFAEWWRTRQQL